MLTILLTGSNGLLGQKIVYNAVSKSGINLIATARGANRTTLTSGYRYETLDITNQEQINQLFEKHKPDVLINTAAATNVDACEVNKEEATQLNVKAVQYLAEACTKYNTHFIHLSTDFIFDGTSGPYSETDIPNPLSHYAKTKWKGEQVIINSLINYAIIRTIIIYGVVDDGHRSNLVLWVKNSLEQGKEINVITDQYRMPTLAEDLAEACVQCALRKAQGIYHVSGSEMMSIWEASMQVCNFFGLDNSLMKPVTTSQLRQPAARPLVTGFNINKAIKELDYHPHKFMQGLALVREQLEK